MIIKAPQVSNIPALRALWKDAFGDTDTVLDAFFQTAFSQKRSLCAIIEDEIVGMLYWFDCTYSNQKIAYLYAVATHKAYRGRGICHSLMDAAHQLLKERGYAGVILVPEEPHLFSFYERIGYTICAHNSIFHTTAAGEPMEIRSISPAEYAALRKRFLPKQSVLQEGENLLFLETLADFWMGDGILFAVRKDTESLFGLELLGDVTLAPRITRTLGFKVAEFRTVGQNAPFAMFRSLSDLPLPLPTYFAFAFD
jgi:predicted N-acetyltransferase YhbS